MQRASPGNAHQKETTEKRIFQLRPFQTWMTTTQKERIRSLGDKKCFGLKICENGYLLNDNVILLSQPVFILRLQSNLVNSKSSQFFFLSNIYVCVRKEIILSQERRRFFYAIKNMCFYRYNS